MNIEKDAAQSGWNFDNSYARLPSSFYASLSPAPVRRPGLVKLNLALAASLGLNTDMLQGDEGAAVFTGNQLPKGAFPLAQAYAGHQFGHFTMLGDGRALLLGEQITPDGERFDIQLKGSGPTPYSRSGDGRAALGPMLREYIISEAMHALGISTTRSLAVATTGEPVIRETVLPGAILTRVASSHIRVGTFQFVSRWGSAQELRLLADYTTARHFNGGPACESRYLFLLKEVVGLQASLIAKWQLIGFIHGVMNTDNMALSGETIDYGPCAFMDSYDPATVFSSIDLQGRYAYKNQPRMAEWNLARFAQTLLPLLHPDPSQAAELAADAVSEFFTLYRRHWLTGMLAKLGLFNEEVQDEALFEGLLAIMHRHRADYTNTFVSLTFNKAENLPFFGDPEFCRWHAEWRQRLDRQTESKDSSMQLMKKSNPAVVPRNHRVEEALDAAVNQGDYGIMEKLLEALSKPFAHSPEQQNYASPSSACSYRTFCGT